MYKLEDGRVTCSLISSLSGRELDQTSSISLSIASDAHKRFSTVWTHHMMCKRFGCVDQPLRLDNVELTFQ